MKCSPIEDITPANTILDFDFYSENSIEPSQKSNNTSKFDSNSLNCDPNSVDSTLFDSINSTNSKSSEEDKYLVLSPVPEPSIQFSVVKEENSTPKTPQKTIDNRIISTNTFLPPSLPKNNTPRKNKRHFKRSSSPKPKSRKSRKYRVYKITGTMDLRELVTISKNKMNLLGSAPQVVNNFSTDIRKAVLISRMLNSIGSAMGNDYIYQDHYYKEDSKALKNNL